MHSAATDNPVYNPTLGGESSFPERHFTTGDSAADWSHQADMMPCLMGTDLDSPQSAATETLKTDLASPWPQDWLSQEQLLLRRNPVSKRCSTVPETRLVADMIARYPLLV